MNYLEGGLLIVVQLLSRVRVFYDPMNCSPLCSSVHWISQARIVEWVAISPWTFLTQGSNPRLLHAGRFFTAEPPGKPHAGLGGPHTQRLVCFQEEEMTQREDAGWWACKDGTEAGAMQQGKEAKEAPEARQRQGSMLSQRFVSCGGPGGRHQRVVRELASTWQGQQYIPSHPYLRSMPSLQLYVNVYSVQILITFPKPSIFQFSYLNCFKHGNIA